MRKRTITLQSIVSLCILLLLLFASPPARGQQRIPTLVEPAAKKVSTFATPAQVGPALGLSASNVISISFGSSSLDGIDVFNTPATSFPTEGGSYLVMSSGATSSALTPNTTTNLSTGPGWVEHLRWRGFSADRAPVAAANGRHLSVLRFRVLFRGVSRMGWEP